jgi:hypothetical protein
MSISIHLLHGFVGLTGSVITYWLNKDRAIPYLYQSDNRKTENKPIVASMVGFVVFYGISYGLSYAIW